MCEFQGPLELVRSAFPDARTNKTIGIGEIGEIMDTIVHQSIADGRITVLINKNTICCTALQIANLYISYFEKYHVPMTLTIGKKSTIITKSFLIPKSAPFFTISSLGYFNCSATFGFIASPEEPIPVFAVYPLICIGFHSPSESAKLRRDFEQFLRKREFPVRQIKTIAKQRTQLESRNRDYLLQTSKSRKDLKQRYTTSVQVLEKKSRQLAVLEEKLESIAQQHEGKTVRRLDSVEDTIQKIDAAINELVDQVESLMSLVDEKADGRHMTRKEELALLESLRKQVRDSRQQLEAFKETQ